MATCEGQNWAAGLKGQYFPRFACQAEHSFRNLTHNAAVLTCKLSEATTGFMSMVLPLKNSEDKSLP
ncbi:hypothetical protein AV530_007658 [Patagioenas fasciata monilis]|uniref:Uncharacterized protein n=1 Tax=Patagioenas fasciata monilis TaxID=372326 RepID=A0A1V4JYY4_PATFA|nr:hypothetical protein AV530_007658 [Patagioenas fasciata monilis]